MSAMPAERRKHFRLDSRIPMRYRTLETDARGFKGSLMKDISVGGTRMTIYEFLPLNLKLAVEIPLISGVKPLEGICRVAWINKAPFSEQYEAGLEFLNLNQEDGERLANFIFNKKTEKVL